MKDPNRDQKVAMPTREGIVNAQISNILSVIATLHPFVMKYSAYRDFNGVENSSSPEMNGEAALAASNTFIKCCARLDECMADGSRWNLDAHDELYSSLKMVNAAQEKFLKTQTEAAATINRPSFQLKPTIAMTTTECIAFWGDLDVAGGAIIGRGATPNLALLDFDAAFHRTPDKQIFSIARQKGIDFAVGDETEEIHPQDALPKPEAIKPKKKGKK